MLVGTGAECEPNMTKAGIFHKPVPILEHPAAGGSAVAWRIRILAALLPITFAAGAATAQERAQVAPVAQPASGIRSSSAVCESCGTIVAINRVVVEGDSPPLAALPQRVLERATVDGTTVSRVPAKGTRQRYEIVVRMSAGTQQVVMSDDLGKLVVGQRVRIDNGSVLPDRG